MRSSKILLLCSTLSLCLLMSQGQANSFEGIRTKVPFTGRNAFDQLFYMQRYWDELKHNAEKQRTTLCGYYLLNVLEGTEVDNQKFAEALTAWSSGYQKLTGSTFSFKTLSTNHEKLRQCLLRTKTGQEYSRFPRISRTDDGLIVKTYPYPELYGLDKATFKIDKSLAAFSFYDARLHEEEQWGNHSVALIDLGDGENFDWPTHEKIFD